MAGDGANIGNAYLTVHPKVANNFESELENAGSRAGGSFGGAFQVALGNIITNVVTSAASFVADTMQQAFSEYANYEQLVGGVNKIFDEMDTSQIFADAQEAYRELNMSANEYMETINQVGAAFSANMGDEKGYQVARDGMLAISDYATGTGLNLDELNDKFRIISKSTQSYQSVCDQFAGILPQTSDDFLAQAQAAGLLSDKYTSLTEVPVAEYQEALVGMLQLGVEGLGLTGNTLEESTKTISGSLAMLDSAWSDFLVAILDENGDVDAAMQKLIDSIGAVIVNAWPVIEQAVKSLFSRIPAALDAVLHENFPQLAAAFDQVKAAVETALPYIIEIIENGVPIMQDVIGGITSFIMNELIPTVQQVWDIIEPAVTTIAESIYENMPMIQDTMASVFNFIGDVVSTVWPVIKENILTAVTVISQAIQVAWPYIEAIIRDTCQRIQFITNTVWPAVKEVVQTVARAITSAIEGISSVVSSVQNTFESIRNAIENPLEAAKSTIESIVSTIESIIGGMNLELPHIALPHFTVYGGSFPWGIGGEGSPPEFSVSWYARGGIIDGAQLIGAGERGAELIWPSYGPYLDRYADAIASRMGGAGGVDIHDCTFVVRREDDIRKVAVQLNTLINRQTAGGIA